MIKSIYLEYEYSNGKKEKKEIYLQEMKVDKGWGNGRFPKEMNVFLKLLIRSKDELDFFSLLLEDEINESFHSEAIKIAKAILPNEQSIA